LDTEIARWQLRAAQLVIVDEAGLAGTLALDELVREASDVGAKVLLAGDWAQLSAVDAGGAFGLLARDENASVAELGEVRRFDSEWERAASIELRHGRKAALTPMSPTKGSPAELARTSSTSSMTHGRRTSRPASRAS